MMSARHCRLLQLCVCALQIGEGGGLLGVAEN